MATAQDQQPDNDAEFADTDESPIPRNALNQPVMPLASYRRRLGALAFDLPILYFGMRGLAWILRDQLLGLGNYQTVAGAVLVLMYFALGNGPVGRGRTIGKLLAGIRTTDLDGKVLGFWHSLGRETIKLLGILHWGILSPFLFDETTALGSLLAWYSWIGIVFPMFIAFSFAIIFNPFKQGPHDFIVGTVVRPVAAPEVAFVELARVVGPNWKRYHRQPQLMAGATILVMALFVVAQMMGNRRMAETNPFAGNQPFGDQLLSRQSIGPMQIYVASERASAQDNASAEAMMKYQARMTDRTTTDTVRYEVQIWCAGAVDVMNPKVKRDLDTLASDFVRDYIPRLRESWIKNEALPTSPDGPPRYYCSHRPVEFILRFYETIHLLPVPVSLREVRTYTYDVPAPMAASAS